MRQIALFIILLLFITAPVSGADSSDAIIHRDHFIYHFDYPPFVQTADSALSVARQRLIELLRDSLDYLPEIYIADSQEEFRRIIGTAIPDWGAAVAMPYRQTVVIKSPARFPVGKSLRELLQHEYTHLALSERLGFGRAPRWLDEGLAMFLSSEWGWEDNISMTRAVLFNNLIPLDEIEKMNLFPEGKAHTAYAQSYLAVKYFLDNYGIKAFNIFLDSLSRRHSVDSALFAAIGATYEGYETEFFDYLRKRYTFMSLFIDTLYIWIILAAVVVIGFILNFLKKRRYYRRWEEEDRLQSRDFDYGDPTKPEATDDDENKPWA